jgi:hypothetical protein
MPELPGVTAYITAIEARILGQRNCGRKGYPLKDEDAYRLSPSQHENINMLGRYSFSMPEAVAKGELRPLRDPENANS